MKSITTKKQFSEYILFLSVQQFYQKDPKVNQAEGQISMSKTLLINKFHIHA